MRESSPLFLTLGVKDPHHLCAEAASRLCGGTLHVKHHRVAFHLFAFEYMLIFGGNDADGTIREVKVGLYETRRHACANGAHDTSNPPQGNTKTPKYAFGPIDRYNRYASMP